MGGVASPGRGLVKAMGRPAKLSAARVMIARLAAVAGDVGQLKQKMQTIRDERDKLTAELDRLDADLKIAKDVIASALTLLTDPRKLYHSCTTTQRKLLNAVVFTKLTVDRHDVTGEQLV